uniref:interleukin-6 receptor subunit alpha isoform X2 n=1 Tax=Scatophagus argus TaxID=75038 RepID=UPI001ED7EFA6|nr:interleukin-6 receptor subunit alpha isoform X2 [Scatophagus argus]
MRKMRIFLSLLCVLRVAPLHSIYDGTCLRKDPPPGVLVLSTGSELVLTCGGHVTVDGVKVRRGSSSAVTPTTANVRTNTQVMMMMERAKHIVEDAVSQKYHSNFNATGENRSLGQTDTGYTASPTALMAQPTSVHRLPRAEGMEEDYEEEEEQEEEGSRVTRTVKPRPQWKWNGRTLGKGDTDRVDFTFERRGATLSLSSVRLTDSGKYTCYYNGRERFSLKVTVADPPEKPKLHCYKKSPSSKIRCEWAPEKPVTIKPTCYLFLSKRLPDKFNRSQCSYSSRTSRCWCALDHNEDEMRTPHLAFLCATSITGNATSTLIDFTPLSILKPDPPSNVTVRQEEGQEAKLIVTWSLPISWKSQDYYYRLLYELKYRPVQSSFDQIQRIKWQRSSFITDAMTGVEYLIQLRTKEEYDGHWSEWSTPVYASSWTATTSATTLSPDYTDTESSGTDDNETDDTRTDLCLNFRVCMVSPCVGIRLSLHPPSQQHHKDRLWCLLALRTTKSPHRVKWKRKKTKKKNSIQMTG